MAPLRRRRLVQRGHARFAEAGRQRRQAAGEAGQRVAHVLSALRCSAVQQPRQRTPPRASARGSKAACRRACPGSAAARTPRCALRCAAARRGAGARPRRQLTVGVAVGRSALARACIARGWAQQAARTLRTRAARRNERGASLGVPREGRTRSRGTRAPLLAPCAPARGRRSAQWRRLRACSRNRRCPRAVAPRLPVPTMRRSVACARLLLAARAAALELVVPTCVPRRAAPRRASRR